MMILVSCIIFCSWSQPSSSLPPRQATNDLARIKREEANAIARQLETQHELEKAFQNTSRLAEDERASFENTLLQERREAQQLYENFNRVREEQALTFQKWAEAPNQKISALEREIGELFDKAKMEVATLQVSMRNLGGLRERS